MSNKGKAAALLLALLVGTSFSSESQATPRWVTVVNNGDRVPTVSPTKNFNSYNQPSISNLCTVAFRARGKGGSGSEPPSGVFQRRMCASPGSLSVLSLRGRLVPQPNNTDATFNEFPAFPRIDSTSNTIATRGQSRPVWEYTLPDGTDTRIGTAGVYANPGGTFRTGMSLLGTVPGFEYFQVPGAATLTRFDQFPGSASPFNTNWVAFKGNYTEGAVAKTGVYVRNVTASTGKASACLIANSDMRIPNQPSGGTTKFGSTAPPSAAGTKVYFLGVDNEDAPTKGGIYSAPAACNPTLTTLVGIGAAVPGVTGATFNKFGEALSVGGRFVGFWGSWGTATRSITLKCPTEGEASVIAYCNAQYPSGFVTTVPVNQGIFVHDTSPTTPAAQRTKLIARTGSSFSDFLYWVFSGRPPASGSGDDAIDEPARWRSSAFVAISPTPDNSVATVFKATGTKGVQGIWARARPASALQTLVTTLMGGRLVDPEAPAGSLVTSVGIERDGFRNCRLAFTASMLNATTSESWAGIYLNQDQSICGS